MRTSKERRLGRQRRPNIAPSADGVACVHDHAARDARGLASRALPAGTRPCTRRALEGVIAPNLAIPQGLAPMKIWLRVGGGALDEKAGQTAAFAISPRAASVGASVLLGPLGGLVDGSTEASGGAFDVRVAR